MFRVSFQKTMNIMISSYAFLLFLLVNQYWISFAKKSIPRSDDAELARFIVGGYLAQDKQFPYAVSVQEYDEERRVYDHKCTFSLITTQSILGAAHCTIGANGEFGEVENYLGVLGNVDSQNRTNKVTFAEFRIHANYDDERLLNDIVIMVLSKPVKTGDSIKTIPLAGPKIAFVGMRGITVGWGQTRAGNVETSRHLRYVDVDIVANELCEYYYEALEKGEVCYGTEGKGTCDGDSGAPIVVMYKNRLVQMGISSFNSDPCAREPTVGVSVHEYDEESRVYDHVCTFSLITTKSILGAAHCMIGENGEIGEVENYFGVLGNVDSQNRTNRVTFAEIRIHANYEDEDFLNDIVIVVLSKAVKTGDYIKTIPLAGPSISFVGMRGITMGWGQTSTDKVEASRYLRYVDVDIVANEVCENYFDALDEDQFCYGTEGKGTCDGDSGAPIVVMFKNKKVQMGIASHGSESCAREPTVGVSVSSYYRWIRSNVKGNPVFVK